MNTKKNCQRENPYNSEFQVEKLPLGDAGKWRVRLSKRNRCGRERHCLVRVSHESNRGYFVALGLQNQKGDIIQMDFDAREILDIPRSKGTNGTSANLEIKVLKRISWGAFCWYVCHRDPNVYIPAYVCVASLILGLLGVGAAFGCPADS